MQKRNLNYFGLLLCVTTKLVTARITITRVFFGIVGYRGNRETDTLEMNIEASSPPPKVSED